MSKRVTMADVAREANVSLMTVSRVINQAESVSDGTRQRILNVIDTLGYRPSGIARGLATQRTGTLGLVVPDIANPFFSGVARGAEQIAYTEGYNVFLCNSEEDPAREVDILQSLEEKRADGLILCSSRLEDDDLAQALSAHAFAVLFNRRIDSDSIRSIMVDDESGAIKLTRYLLSSGRRRIAMLAGPPASHSGHQRLRGYRAALAAADLILEDDLAIPCTPSVTGGMSAASDLLSAHSQLDALICYNDLVAVGALQACAELELSVPEDIAIAGFDDIPISGLVTPPLTTCSVPLQTMGEAAMRLLLNQISGCNSTDLDTVFYPELVVRAST